MNCRPAKAIDKKVKRATGWNLGIVTTLRGLFENSIKGFKSMTPEQQEAAYGENGEHITQFYEKMNAENKKLFEKAIAEIKSNQANKYHAILSSISYGQYTVLKQYVGKILNEFGVLNLENMELCKADPNRKTSKDIMCELLQNEAYKTDFMDIMGVESVTWEDIKNSHSKRVLYNLACNIIISQAIADGNLSLKDFIKEVYSVYYNSIATPKRRKSKIVTEAVELANELGGDLFTDIITVSAFEMEQRTGIKWKRKNGSEYDSTDEELSEESVLEGWMQKIDKSSTFGRSSSFIRLLCGLVPRFTKYRSTDKGTFRIFDRVESDDCDPSMFKTWDTKKLYDAVHICMRDVANADDMIVALSSSENASIRLLASIANSSDRVKAELFKAMYSFHQEYTSNKVSSLRNRTRGSFFNKLLSNAGHTASNFKEFRYRLLEKVSSGRTKAQSIFTLQGKKTLIINKVNLESFIVDMLGSDNVKGCLMRKNDSFGTIVYTGAYGENTSAGDNSLDSELKSVLRTINDSLSLGLTTDAINSLATIDVTNLGRLLTQVHSLCTMLSTTLKNNPGSTLYYNTIFGNSKNKTIQDTFNTMLKIVSEANDYCNMMVRDNKSKSNYAKDAKTSDFGRHINKFRSFRRRLLEINGKYAINDTATSITGQAITTKEQIIGEMRDYLAKEYLFSPEYYIGNYKEISSGHFFSDLAKMEPKEREQKIKEIADRIINPWVKELFETNAETYNENSFLNHLCNSGEKIISSEVDRSSVLTEDMNERQNVAAFINSFFREETSEGYSHYAMPTMGDAQIIRTMEGRKYDYETLKGIFANIALSELARMSQETKLAKQAAEKGLDVEGITVNKHDQGVIGNFVYLRCLNDHKSKLAEYVTINRETGEMEINRMPELINLIGDLLLGKLNEDGTFTKGELAKEFSEDFANKLNESMPSIFDTKEVTTLDPDGNESDETTTQFVNIPGVACDSVFKDLSTKKEFVTDATSPLFMYYLNHKAAIIMQLQFLHKNPAAYTGEAPDGTLKPLSVVFQKRFKAENTPGDPMNTSRTFNGEKMPETQNVLYLKEFKQDLSVTSPEMYNNLLKKFIAKYEGESNAEEKAKNDLKEYLRAKSTDGQGWRTFKSYRDIMIMSGNWDGKKEEAYKKVQEYREKIRTLKKKKYKTEQDKRELGELIGQLDRLCKGKFTSTKPHLSGYEKIPITDSNGNTINEICIPVEHKYAEMILIPELYSEDNVLYHLGTYMENSDIDMACSEECVKVGNWAAAEVPPIGTDHSVFKQAFDDATRHTFDYENLEIQTEVPPHTDTAQLMGTQMRKHVLATIMKNGQYNLFSATLGGKLSTVTVAGEKLDLTDPEHGGENLTKVYNVLVSKKILDSFLDQAEMIADPDKLANALTEMESKGINISPEKLSRYRTYIDENGVKRFAIPLNEMSKLYDTESSIMSIFSKKINKQKMRGGSLVQVSAIGMPELRTHFDKNGNPTTCDMAATWDGSIVINGIEVKLKYEDYVNYDGTLIMDNDESGEAVQLKVLQKKGEYDGTDFNSIADSETYENVKVVDVEDKQGNVTKKRIYLRDKNGEVVEGKGYFEVVKEKEEGEYSVYFRTGNANTGEIYGSTAEERQILYKAVADIIPAGAKLSTKASQAHGITKGGEKGLNTLAEITNSSGNQMFETLEETREGYRIGKQISKLDKYYPGFTDRIAYRIPTEKSYSIISGKIVKFLPSYMGNVVAVPTEYMVAAGFDFDIDKLYYLKREHHIRYSSVETGTVSVESTSPLVRKIWENIYEEKDLNGNKILDVLRNAREANNEQYRAQREQYTRELKQIIRTTMDRWHELYSKVKERAEDEKDDDPIANTFVTLLGEKLKTEITPEYFNENNVSEDIIDSIVKKMVNQQMKDFIENSNGKLIAPSNKLYNYWKIAYGDTFGTHQEAFDDYLASNPREANELDRINRTNHFLKKRGETEHTYYKRVQENVSPIKEEQGSALSDIDLSDMESWELDNIIFDIIKSRIEDPNTIIDRYTPGGFATGKQAALDIKAIKYSGKYNKDNIMSILNDHVSEDYEPIYDLTNPYTIALYNARNIVASKVIGIAANHSTNYAYSKTLGGVNLTTPITLFDKSLSDLNCKEGGWMLAEFLAASVDAVKAPVLNFLNINSKTANVAMLLGRAGFSMFEIGVFLNQPIIQKVIDKSSEGRGQLAYNIQKVAKEVFGDKKVDLKPEMKQLDTKTLMENLISDPNENLELQKDILKVLGKLIGQANELNNFVKQTKYTASNSVDNTVGSTAAAYYSMIELNLRNSMKAEKEIVFTRNDGTELDNPIEISVSGQVGITPSLKDRKEYLRECLRNPLAMEQTMFDCGRGFAEGLYKYFPYTSPLYDVTYRRFASNSVTGELNSDTIGYINKELPLFLISLGENSNFNPRGTVYLNLNTMTFSDTIPTETISIDGEEIQVNAPYHEFTNIDLYSDGGTTSYKDLNVVEDYKTYFRQEYVQLSKGIELGKYGISEEQLSQLGYKLSYKTDITYVLNKLSDIRAHMLRKSEINDYLISIAAMRARVKESGKKPEEVLSKDELEDYYMDIEKIKAVIRSEQVKSKEIAKELCENSMWLTPKDAAILTSPIITSNMFLEALIPIAGTRKVVGEGGNVTEVYDDKRFGIQNNMHFDKDLSPLLMEGWAALQTNIPMLSRALFFTNYFTKGYSMGRNNFNMLAPNNLIESLQVTPDTNYISFLEQLNSGEGTIEEVMNNKELLAQFFCNFYRIHHDLYTLVPTIYNNYETFKYDGKGHYTYTDTDGAVINIDNIGDNRYKVRIPATSMLSLGISTTTKMSSSLNGETTSSKVTNINTVPAFKVTLNVPIYPGSTKTTKKEMVLVSSHVLSNSVEAQHNGPSLFCDVVYEAFEPSERDNDYSASASESLFTEYKGQQIDDLLRMSMDSENMEVGGQSPSLDSTPAISTAEKHAMEMRASRRYVEENSLNSDKCKEDPTNGKEACPLSL